MAMTTKQAAEKWGISDRRVRTLCANGQIDGAWREGNSGLFPTTRPSLPMDGFAERKRFWRRLKENRDRRSQTAHRGGSGATERGLHDRIYLQLQRNRGKYLDVARNRYGFERIDD